MNDARLEAERWFLQAENDLLFAESGRAGGFYAQTCFLCQQAAEKAVKAVWYGLGERIVYGHSVAQLLKGLAGRAPGAEALVETGGRLDQFYPGLFIRFFH
jgi:HEPN domain-containing protein